MKLRIPSTEQWFANHQSGVALSEYALVGALIGIACALTLASVGINVGSLFVRVCNGVSVAITGLPAC